MRIVSVFITIILLTSISGCKKSSPTGPVTIVDSFVGNWQITSAGAVIAGGTMQIRSDGTIVGSLTGQQSYKEYFPVTLHISEDGSLKSDIVRSSVKVGIISGTFSSFGNINGTILSLTGEVGTFVGVLGSKDGDGTYQSTQGNGTWSATKQ